MREAGMTSMKPAPVAALLCGLAVKCAAHAISRVRESGLRQAADCIR